MSEEKRTYAEELGLLLQDGEEDCKLRIMGGCPVDDFGHCEGLVEGHVEVLDVLLLDELFLSVHQLLEKVDGHEGRVRQEGPGVDREEVIDFSLALGLGGELLGCDRRDSLVYVLQVVHGVRNSS